MSNWLIHSYSVIHGIQNIHVRKQTLYPLGSCFTTGLFLPPLLWVKSLNASTYLLSLQTTLIQSFFHRQGKFLAPNLSVLRHWLECCVNGELSEMALLHPRCLLIMSIFFSVRIVCGKTTAFPPNAKWQRMPFLLCGSNFECNPTFVTGLVLWVLTDHTWNCLLKLVLGCSFWLGFWW